MSNRNNRNNGTRSRKGQPQNRKLAVSTQNERTLTRRFIINEKVALNSSSGSNTILNRTLQWNGGELQGFNAIAAGFDQYRIRRIQLYATSVANTVTQLQIAQSLAQQPIYANASTTIYSAVDVTGAANPGPDIQAYQNCEFRQPQPYAATKLADFTPRLSDSGDLLYATNTWMSTANTTKLWNGVHLRFVNSNGTSIFPSPADAQEFNLRSVVHVEFRHPIYDTVTLIQRVNAGRSETVPAPVRSEAEVARIDEIVHADEQGDF